jgi:hypothetical protein
MSEIDSVRECVSKSDGNHVEVEKKLRFMEEKMYTKTSEIEQVFSPK